MDIYCGLMVYNTLRLKEFYVKFCIFAKKLWEKVYLVTRFLFLENISKKVVVLG
jgi:hypothetical protein